jgi:hypothetical protein
VVHRCGLAGAGKPAAMQFQELAALERLIDLIDKEGLVRQIR